MANPSYLSLVNPTDLLFYVEEVSHPSVSVSCGMVFYTKGSAPARIMQNSQMLMEHGYKCPITGVYFEESITPRLAEFDNRSYTLTTKGRLARILLEQRFVPDVVVKAKERYLIDINGVSHENFVGYITEIIHAGKDTIYEIYGNSRYDRDNAIHILVCGTEAISVTGTYNLSRNICKSWRESSKLSIKLKEPIAEMLKKLQIQREERHARLMNKGKSNDQATAR